jgi:hypothetical protein
MICGPDILKIFGISFGSIAGEVSFGIVVSALEFKIDQQCFALQVDHAVLFSPVRKPLGAAIQYQKDGFQNGRFPASHSPKDSKKTRSGELFKLHCLFFFVGIKALYFESYGDHG